MTNVDNFDASFSLRLRHPRLKADQLLPKGMKASTLHDVGGERHTPRGRKLQGAWPDSYCCVDVVHRGPSFEAQLAGVIEGLTAHSRLFLSVRESGGSAELFVGLFFDSNAGLTVNREMLRALEKIGLDLTLDCYPQGKMHNLGDDPACKTPSP